MDKAKADELCKSAGNALAELYKQWLEERGANHDTVHGALFANANLYYSAVLAVDIGMDKETFLKAAGECFDAALAKAPKWS